MILIKPVKIKQNRGHITFFTGKLLFMWTWSMLILKKSIQNEKKSVDKAVKDVSKSPDIGDLKVGDLSGVSVFKFKVSDL